MAAIWFEPGSDATYDFSFYSATVGGVTSSATQAHTGPRSIRCTPGASPGSAYCYKSSILADAGRRISAWVYIDTLPSSNNCPLMTAATSAGTFIFKVLVTSTGKLRLFRNGSQIGEEANISTGVWHQVTLSYTITSTSVYSARVTLDGVTVNSTTSSGNLVETGTSRLQVGMSDSVSANTLIYVDNVYVDDGTGVDYPGDVRVTAKLPASENTNNFNTAIGAGRGTTDYNNINERPYSETNGWLHVAATDVQENYGLQSASTGDVDISTKTLIARTAWAIAKKGGPPSGVITEVGIGAEGSAASGNITLGAPASPQTDDIWIAVVHSSDQVAHTFTDWAEIVQGNGGDTTSRLSVWYFRYAGATPNLIVTHSAGQSPIGGIVAFRGCKVTGSPVCVTGTIAGGNDGSIEHNAITPTVGGCALLVLNGSADDNNRTALGGDYVVAFEDTGGGTQGCYQTTAGTPDGSVSFFYDLSVPASSTGTITVTQAAADPWASVLIALEPETETGGSPDLMDNGTETSITLSTSSALYEVLTNSASYPSNAAGIGLRSSGTGIDTYLYECGTLIAYIPSDSNPPMSPPPPPLSGMRRRMFGLGR